MTVAIGADIARFGKDLTGIAIVDDRKVVGLDEWSHRDLMETTGRIVRYLEAYPGSVLAVDDTGLGGGVVDRLSELGIDLLAVNYGQEAYEKTRFRDKASEMWWRLRELFDPDGEEPLVLPRNHRLVRRLMAQLSGAKYKFDSRGRIWVIKSDEGSESPGLGDAIVLAYEAWVTYWASSNEGGGRVIYNKTMFGHLAEDGNA